MSKRSEAIISAGERRARNAASVRSIVWAFVWIVIFGTVGTAIHNGLVKAENDQALVKAKYAKWLAYRDSSCVPIQQMLGIVVGEGKFAHEDNAMVWQCKNGMQYLISRNAEHNIGINNGQLDQIPTVP